MFGARPNLYDLLRGRLATEISSAEECLRAGDSEGAKQQLEKMSLLGLAEPEDCRRIARIYWELGFPCMAGRFWYVCDESDPDIEWACREFERSCGDNLNVIAQSLPRLDSPDDSKRMQQLRERLGFPAVTRPTPNPESRGRLVFYGCALVFIICVTAFVSIFFVGLASITEEFVK
ncbi:MAG: DUF6584 family protein [Pirellulales bacterium]